MKNYLKRMYERGILTEEKLNKIIEKYNLTEEDRKYIVGEE